MAGGLKSIIVIIIMVLVVVALLLGVVFYLMTKIPVQSKAQTQASTAQNELGTANSGDCVRMGPVYQLDQFINLLAQNGISLEMTNLELQNEIVQRLNKFLGKIRNVFFIGAIQ